MMYGYGNIQRRRRDSPLPAFEYYDSMKLHDLKDLLEMIRGITHTLPYPILGRAVEIWLMERKVNLQDPGPQRILEYCKRFDSYNSLLCRESTDFDDELQAVIDEREMLKGSTTTILNLPTEVLSLIFDMTGELQRGMKLQNPNIPKIRLTCRRFHDVASASLLNKIPVKVSFSDESLGRLRAISNHPLIRKGVETVMVDLSYYGSHLAQDERAFASDCADQLEMADQYCHTQRFYCERSIQNRAIVLGISREEAKRNWQRQNAHSVWDVSHCLEQAKTKEQEWLVRAWKQDRAEYNRALDRLDLSIREDQEQDEELAELRRILQHRKSAMEEIGKLKTVFRNAAEDGFDESDPHHVRLRQTHRQYQELFATQQRLHREGIRTIAAAMFKMIRARGLLLCDEQTRQFRTGDPDVDGAHWVYPQLLAPIKNWGEGERRGIGPPPTDLLVKLPLALSKAGSGLGLSSLRLIVVLPLDLTGLAMNQQQRDALKAATSRLENFGLTISKLPGQVDYDTWYLGEPVQYRILMDYVSSHIASTTIERVGLRFEALSRYVPPAIEQIMPEHGWPQLRLFRYAGPFRADELKRLMSNYTSERKLWLILDGHLVRGTWRDVLDFLQHRVTRFSRIGSRRGFTRGAEWDVMTADQREHVFGEGYGGSPWSSENRATDYVVGPYLDNPIREVMLTSDDESQDWGSEDEE